MNMIELRQSLLRVARAVLASLLLTIAVCTPTQADEAGTRPNIILILADDFGYECLGANGGTSYETPHLDRLAAEGLRFERCYAQPLCTPTRVQLMTGIYNVRNYVDFGNMDPKATTFANLLKESGYRNGSLFDVADDPQERRPLDNGALSDAARAAKRSLQAVLDAHKNARPPHLRQSSSAPEKR